jgi:hypothetical protein
LTGSQKILLELFGVNFMDEATANRIIRTQVIGGLALYQMFEFYSTFGLRDPSIWGDLSYEDAYRMLESLREKKKDVINETVKDIVKDPPPPTTTLSNSRSMANRPAKITKLN